MPCVSEFQPHQLIMLEQSWLIKVFELKQIAVLHRCIQRCQGLLVVRVFLLLFGMLIAGLSEAKSHTIFQSL